MAPSRVDRRLTRTRPPCLIAIALLMGALPIGLSAQAPTAPLRILLTNDDGYEAEGIVALREALIGGGHDVIVVAPSANRSGSSASRSSGILTYTEASPGVWHVDGSPADAVGLALNFLLRDSLPDLVVSGTNAGQNIGTSTSHSGTVGAAVTAARRGLPAVAVSAQLGRSASRSEVFEGAGQFALDLIDRLVAGPSPDGTLLPPHTVLNVNHPALSSAEVRGVRFMPVSDVEAYERFYEPTDAPGEVRVGLRGRSVDDIEAGTDVSLLAAGYITVNLIDANGDAGATRLGGVSSRLAPERE